MSEGKTSEIQIEQGQCDRKCIHPGDRICYNETITKELLKTIPDSTNNSFSECGNESSLHSGESSYKTFTFDADVSDPDMEKCMNFWKSVLPKNAKPLKCTLLKTKKNSKKESPKAKCPLEEEKGEWLKIYKDLQRRKLDQIKLVNTKPCDPCPPSFDDEYDKKEEVQEIKKLNTWKPKSQQPKMDMKSQMHRTAKLLQTARSQHPAEGAKKTKQMTSAASSRGSSVQGKRTSEGVKEEKLMKVDTKTPSLVKDTILPVEKAPEGVFKEPPPPPKAQEKSPLPEPELCSCSCNQPGCACTTLNPCKIDPQTNNDCSDDCVCPTDLCVCGCRIEDCICESTTCLCGCEVNGCICGASNDVCCCGCGMEQCICEELYAGKSCKCGSADCNCDTIEVLNAYLASLEGPKVAATEEVKMVAEECQTEGEEKRDKFTKKPGIYCVICGHYDCDCTEERK